MVVGLGLDVIEIERIGRAMRRHGERFTRRILTAGERAAIHGDPVRYLASRFAAKEAAAKALGTGIRGEVTWHAIEVLADPSGRPRIALGAGARVLAQRWGAVAVHLSLTHTREHAAAVVVLDKGGSRP